MSRQFELVTLTEQPTLTIRFQAQQPEFATKFAEVLPATYQYAISQGCQLSGPPFSLYHAFDPNTGIFDVEAGVQVSQPATGDADVKASTLPSGPAVSLLHVGPYEQLGEAHEALRSWVAENGKQPRGGPWEVYLNDPSQVPDPQQLQTQLIQPIE